MDAILLAALVQEGSRVLTEVLRMRTIAVPRQETALKLLADKQEAIEAAYLSGPPPEQYKLELEEEKTPSLSEEEFTDFSADREVAAKAQSIESGCVVCALGHFGTCSGLLNEAVRFSDNGMDDPEVIERLNACLDEFNAMERIDLRPEKIRSLPEWEKRIAEKALKTSRSTRHAIEGCRTKDQLVELAADTQTVRQDIGKEWFQTKIRTFSQEDKEAIAQRVVERLENLGTEVES